MLVWKTPKHAYILSYIPKNVNSNIREARKSHARIIKRGFCNSLPVVYRVANGSIIAHKPSTYADVIIYAIREFFLLRSLAT